MKSRRKLSGIHLLAVLFVSACSVRPDAPPVKDTAIPPAETTVTAIPSTHAPAWQTYHSAQVGYSVEYPADWTVNEQLGSDDSSVTTFSSPDSSSAIVVMVQSGEFGGAGSSDLPNTRCEEVKIGELTGTRCLDTLTLSVSTTIVSRGKTYIITSTSKRLDLRVYDRFLASFRIL